MDDALNSWGLEPQAELAALCQQHQDKSILDLVLRYAPHIHLDDVEPFEPLATGYSVIQSDGPSPSFNRSLRLATSRGKANRVIEYAVWWDWDINHLYELEHLWVYLGDDGQILKVEGSWHGEVKDLSRSGRLTFKDDHPIVLAEPGKHAFGLNIQEFRANQNKVPGLTSRFAGAHGTFLNSSYKEQIRRTPPSDRLVQSYLTHYAFTPSWHYSEIPIPLENKPLVPWPILRDWIPLRVNAWLQYLEQNIEPSDYRYLRTAICYSISDIRKAASHNLDVIQIGVGRNFLGLPVMIGPAGRSTGPNMLSILKTCRQLMLGHHLVLHYNRVIPWITRMLNLRDLSNYLMVGCDNPDWLVEVKKRAPNYRTVLISERPVRDIVPWAQKAKASYVQFDSDFAQELSDAEIRDVHRAGIGIIAGPVRNYNALTHLQKLGLDSIVVEDPALFQDVPETPGQLRS